VCGMFSFLWSMIWIIFLSYMGNGEFLIIGSLEVSINGKPLKSTRLPLLFRSSILTRAVGSTIINNLGLLVRLVWRVSISFLTCFYWHIEFSGSLRNLSILNDKFWEFVLSLVIDLHVLLDIDSQGSIICFKSGCCRRDIEAVMGEWRR
jgi:hypothetical protein